MPSSRATWLTPAAEAWEAVMGKGTFPFGMAGRHLKPLVEAGHSEATIAAHLAEYLAKNDPQYLNLARFAMTFQKWAPTPPTLTPPLVDDFGVLRS